jgi:hypothetical protein
MDRKLGGPQSRSGRRGEEKILDPTRTRELGPLGRPARSQSIYRPQRLLQFSHIQFQEYMSKYKGDDDGSQVEGRMSSTRGAYSTLC